MVDPSSSVVIERTNISTGLSQHSSAITMVPFTDGGAGSFSMISSAISITQAGASGLFDLNSVNVTIDRSTISATTRT